ncbi:AAA family ATPase [Bordetella sp. H567]|uniref:type VI secretion system ATPase TssH n=1 Tax=Bordetella sp. H567 TaxID=1697043 RepID=UPI00081CC005|nr:type VI secretion system ATPase TssH [Bordetella sp. H567]AOB32508.1 AAA family ATPase [Bordetella sp. H567]
MAEISRAVLFGKLDALAYRSIESATVFCKLRGNPRVVIEHWLHQILQGQDSDLHGIVRHFGLGMAVLARDLTDALERLPRSAAGAIDLSPHVDEAVERAWVYASLMYGATQVRTGHLVIALLKTASLRRRLAEISSQFARIECNALVERFDALLASSPEHAASAPPMAAAPGEASGAIPAAALGAREALARYTVDLTAQARDGKLDPIVGRDEEVRQVMDILLRRRQNNPILTGEAGVGKTAVVEGLAQRIVAGEVPPALRSVALRTLDVGLLQAGASMKGEFEQRLRQVVEEAQSQDHPVILFIDEAHTLIGAGGAAGTGDAANLLKPALARGSLRTIAATTWAEYKKHIEKDPALTRRFQPVAVCQPDEARALRMLRGLAPAMESHHGVRIADEALRAAVQLSHRYIADRQLPDKAVSLLDTVGARVAASRHATPPAIEQLRAAIAAKEAELALLEREAALGRGAHDRVARLGEELAADRQACADAVQHWEAEKRLVADVLACRAALIETPPAGDDDPRLAALRRMDAELEACQGEAPLVLLDVDRQAVAAVVQDWTGIPVGRMVADDVDGLLALEDTLNTRIVGQPGAIALLARYIRTARAGLNRPGRPVGVFLLAGSSGVGKTETALALAEALYGGEQNLITLNMSEYQEPHTVSTLKGAPPGYVGYGQGGVLTEAVRRKPYSVILLDEVEKAHPDVHEVFYQVFDKGWMEDGEGRVIDFRNTLILLTTNAGTDQMLDADEASRGLDDLCRVLRAPLLRVFPAALLARMTIVPYLPLGPDSLAAIVRQQLDRLASRMHEQQGVAMHYDETVVAAVLDGCEVRESGARLIDTMLAQQLLPVLSHELLVRKKDRRTATRVGVRVEEGAWQCDFD